MVIGRQGLVPGVAYHEAHLLRRNILGRDDEVAFILAVLGVKDDDEFASSWEHVTSISDCSCSPPFPLKHRGLGARYLWSHGKEKTIRD